MNEGTPRVKIAQVLEGLEKKVASTGMKKIKNTVMLVWNGIYQCEAVVSDND